jgi:hypothetical protein
MQKFLYSLLFFITITFCNNALGANDVVDPVWEKAVAQFKQNNKWVAKNIEQVVLETPKGEPTKKITVHKQFARMEKAKPVYTVLDVTPPLSDPKDADQNVDFGAMFLPLESTMFGDNAAIKRIGSQVLNGKTLAVFEFSNKGLNVKLWIDPDTGERHQRVFQGAMPFVMSGVITTSYSTGAGSRNLPKNAITKVSVSIPFQKAEVEIKDTYSNWIELP